MSNIANITLNGTSYPLKDALQRERIKVPGRRFIFIADSFGNYTYSGYNFMRYAGTELLGLTYDTDYYVSFANGACFADGSFLSLIQSIDADDPDTITDVMVLTAGNDAGRAGIETAMDTFRQYVYNTYPNAELHLGYTSVHKYAGANNDQFVFYETMLLYSTKHKYKWIPNMRDCMHNVYFVSSDGVHPTSDGVLNMASGLAQYIVSGNASMNTGYQGMTLKSNTNNAVISGLDTTITNGMVLIDSANMGFVSITFGIALSITGDFNTTYDLGELDKSYWVSITTVKSVIIGHHCTVTDQGVGIFDATNVVLFIDQGHLKMKIKTAAAHSNVVGINMMITSTLLDTIRN